MLFEKNRRCSQGCTCSLAIVVVKNGVVKFTNDGNGITGSVVTGVQNKSLVVLLNVVLRLHRVAFEFQPGK